uniref:Uncharacterized protein n=1 Tax=Oryza brachyantha TaxID=4533 RepID=J3N8J5_ORYBR
MELKPRAGDHRATQKSALSEFFSFNGPLTVNMGLLAMLFVKLWGHIDILQSVSSCIFFLGLGSSVLLRFYGMIRTMDSLRIHSSVDRAQWIQWMTWPSAMAYASTVLQMVATAALLLLFDTIYRMVALPLLLVLIMALLAVLLREAAAGSGLPASSQTVSMGFSGLLGTVAGYVKSSPEARGAGGGGYRLPDCFMLYGVLLGLLVMLLSSVPPRVDHPSTRPNVAAVYLPVLAYAALLFLVSACVVAADAILREFAFFGFIVLAVWCFWKEHTDGPEPPATGSSGSATCVQALLDPKLSQNIHSFYIIPSFSILMASYATYTTTGHHLDADWTSDQLFKRFNFAVFCSILTNAGRMVVRAEAQGRRSMLSPLKTWTVAAYVTAAMAIVLLCVLVPLRPNLIRYIIP